MNIQEAIDCLPAGGGKVRIPSGVFVDQPQIIMRSGVILEGQGASTIIPPVKGPADRSEGLGLRDLVINTSALPCYAIDWRNVSWSHISHVLTQCCTYGLVMDYAAYYNDVESLNVDASVCAVELYGGANQNTFKGGRWTAPLGINLAGSNGNTFVGVSIEGAAGMTFVQGNASGSGNKFVNVRTETLNYGPVWLNS